MMINKRLIGTVPESRKYVTGNVALQWLSLLANMAMMTAITAFLVCLALGKSGRLGLTAAVAAGAVVLRFACTVGASRMSYLSSKAVKHTLRERIYRKLLRLGASYRQSASTAEVVQVAVEGVDQLETYFGAYLPQFFYAMLAPLTLFVCLSFVSLSAALVLLACVPLIPVSIAAVQTWAKKLLSKYWGQYTALGDTFLENLQGLTTLKIYQSDGFKQEEMNAQAEQFRKITIFKGTVRDNLRMGKPDAADDALWAALEQVKLADFLRSERGLDTPLTGRGDNLSGGQRQRLALARALLHDSPVYIFDEATSNIDVESENDIMVQIHALSRSKTVILISHRLANAAEADHIYVMVQGTMAEHGTHRELLAKDRYYAKLWNAQQSLENYGREGKSA